MKSFIEYIHEQELLNESPNYLPSATKLPVIIFVSTKRASHSARIKFQNNYNPNNVQANEFLTMTIDAKNPEIINPNNKTIKVKEKDIRKIKDWVRKNHVPLNKYWNNEITTEQFEKEAGITS